MTSPIVPTNTKHFQPEKCSPSNIQETRLQCVEKVRTPSSADYEIASPLSSSSSNKATDVNSPTHQYMAINFVLPDMEKLVISKCGHTRNPIEGDDKAAVRFGVDTKSSGRPEGTMKSEEAFPRPSKSEEAFERRQTRRSDNSMTNKLFRSRCRTITPCPGRRSKRSTLLMQSEKGRPGLRRHTTVEALPDEDITSAAGSWNNAAHSKKLSRPILAIRANSVRSERRGRSLFRYTNPSQRSRARSPVRRGGMTRLARKESAEPGERYTSWGAKIMSRLDREKMREKRDKDNGGNAVRKE